MGLGSTASDRVITRSQLSSLTGVSQYEQVQEPLMNKGDVAVNTSATFATTNANISARSGIVKAMVKRIAHDTKANENAIASSNIALEENNENTASQNVIDVKKTVMTKLQESRSRDSIASESGSGEGIGLMGLF